LPIHILASARKKIPKKSCQIKKYWIFYRRKLEFLRFFLKEKKFYEVVDYQKEEYKWRIRKKR